MSQKNSFLRFFIFFVLVLCSISCVEQNETNNSEQTNNGKLVRYQTALNTADKVKLLTWNIQDLGRTKDESEVLQIAKIIKSYDIVAIQEVVAKDPRGAQAVAKIVDNLNRMGSKWDYKVSDPTKSSSPQASERYAFIWKTSSIKMVERPFLDAELQNNCEREPFVGKFKRAKGTTPFYIVNVHSVPHNKSPEQEIIHFKDYQKRLETDLVFICGDFNLNEKHAVWDEFYKMGFESAVQNNKTTLKRACKDGNYLNHPIDNIYFDGDVILKERANKVDFVNTCDNLDVARGISDHLPVFLEFSIL